MRTFIRIVAAISAFLFMASCAPKPSISVNPASVSVKAAGGKTTVEVLSNCDWVVNCSQSWVSARKNESDGNLTVNVSKNSSPDSRTATITLMSEGARAVITVNQEQKNSLVIDGEFIVYASEDAQDVSLNLKTNTDYKATVAGGADWVKLKAITKGVVETKAVFTLEANDSYESRTADITFEAEDCTPINAKVTQYGKARYIGFGVSGIESFALPVINNGEGKAYVTVGDKETDYVPGESVAVKSSGDDVTVKIYQLQTVQLEGINGIKSFDLTKLY